MKRFLPHLLYIALIAVVGLFYRQRLQIDNQWIALLNRPTDEALSTAIFNNGKMQKHISEQVKEYPSPRNDELALIASKADSLIRISYTDTVLRDSLSSHLWMMSFRDPGILKAYRTLLASKKQVGFSPEHQTVLSQTDSLRRYLAYSLFLNIYAEQTSMGGTKCYYFEPIASHTVLYPLIGQPFETEIALKGYITGELLQVSANGRSLSHEEGLAHFKHTYPKPGVYPLYLKTEFKPQGYDRLLISEKTFYLHVK